MYRSNRVNQLNDPQNIMELGGLRDPKRVQAKSDAFNASMEKSLELAKSGKLPWQQQKKADAAQKFLTSHPRRKPSSRAESYDLYDVVLDHLLDEGYADTEESAEAIMINMSEEWIDEIISEADSLAAQRARREARQRANMKKHGTPGFDYSKTPEQAAADREAQFQKFVGKKKPTSTNEAFNIFVNTLLKEGMNLDNYSWDDLRYAFNDIFVESSQANRDPDKYERESRKTETRGQTAERRVRARLATMDPEARKKMEAQMRAVGLNV